MCHFFCEPAFHFNTKLINTGNRIICSIYVSLNIRTFKERVIDVLIKDAIFNIKMASWMRKMIYMYILEGQNERSQAVAKGGRR